MPRIFIHTPEPASAAARYVRELLLSLAVLDVRTHLLCPENFQFRDELHRNPIITVTPMLSRANSTRRNFWARLTGNLKFLLSSCLSLLHNLERGDIVHFQFVLHFPFGALYFIAAKLCGSGIVFTVHDPVPHKWLLGRRLRWLERGTLAWAYRVSDKLIVHSDAGRKTLVDQFAIKPGRIAIIPHGPYQLPRDLAQPPSSGYLEFLMFGSIRENKGIDLAIQAIQLLSARNIPVRLTIAGEVLNHHEGKYWKNCQALIAKNPAPIRVLQSFIPDSKLPELFESCHCVLLPYRNFHSDSGVAQMALANGCPIAATRVGGLGPLMQTSNVIIPIEGASVQEVMEAILTALDLGVEGLADLGRRSASYVRSEGGWGKIAELTRALYLQAKSDKKAGHPPSQTDATLEARNLTIPESGISLKAQANNL